VESPARLVLRDYHILEKIRSGLLNFENPQEYVDELNYYIDSQHLSLANTAYFLDALHGNIYEACENSSQRAEISNTFNMIKKAWSIPITSLEENPFINSDIKSTFVYLSDSNYTIKHEDGSLKIIDFKPDSTA